MCLLDAYRVGAALVAAPAERPQNWRICVRQPA
jgi:hypothetical protein